MQAHAPIGTPDIRMSQGVLNDWNNKTTPDTCLPAAEQYELQPDAVILEMNFSAARVNASFEFSLCMRGEMKPARKKIR